MSKPIGIYLHIPFCDGKCPYCDFYSRRGSGDEYDRFLVSMIKAIQTAPVPSDCHADTIYFGGGTPVLLGAQRLLRLLEAVRQRFGVHQREITLEANPCAVSPAMLHTLRQGGFSRISFGVQSLSDQTLQTLGRRHSAAQAITAIEQAADAGFSHISADLMLAVPGQTLAEIEYAIDRLAQTPIDHLSAYLLKIEPQTPFFARFTDPDEDFAAECYLAMVHRCEKNGFSQYEISNFARQPEGQSFHNLHYWHCEEYLGIGPAAHSFIRGQRFYFPQDLDSFLAATDPWALTVADGMGGDEEEQLLLGLRLKEGVALSAFSPARRNAIQTASVALIQAGLFCEEQGRIFLTTEGFLLSNSIIAALLRE